MKNKIIYLFLLLLLSTATTSILAQEECGTEITQVQIDYMNATREARESLKASKLKSNTVTIIPMVAHIVRKDDGTGGLTRSQLNIAMVQLNAAFEQVDFEFRLCEINYIDNTDYNNDIENSEEATSLEFQMAHANRMTDKLNVFFIQNISGCGWASFPSFKDAYDKDWIVMANNCATNGSTLAHEVGHWFNLYHTHQEYWDEHTGISITASELVDGSNCGPNVGDELCDTPADPRLGSSSVRHDCIYTGNDKDANGDLYTPDANNIMSYSLKECRTFFSPEQIARMQTSYIYDTI